MNVVIPFHNGDAHLAIDLVKWIGQLGGIGDGHILMICDSGTELENIDSANKAVSVAGCVLNDWPAVIGWPQGSNSLFRMALSGLGGRIKGPWLWLEPDAIPLKRGWLDAIRKEYESLPTRVGMVPGKWETDTSAKSSPHPSGDRVRYMGNVYVCDNPQLPNRLMSGIGVYPADAKEELEHFTTTQYAWDVEAARFLVENCAHTRLIHHFWGIMGMPPTFAAARTPESPPNTFTLESIHKDAVIFHRNKDGTLLELLKTVGVDNETVVTPAHTFPEPTGKKPESVVSIQDSKPITNDAELIAKIRNSVEDW